MWTHRTEDGYTLTAFSAGYMDWGLKITNPEGIVLLDNPHYLSNDSWGYDVDESSETGEMVTYEWVDFTWKLQLAEQADDLIEGVMG